MTLSHNNTDLLSKLYPNKTPNKGIGEALRLIKWMKEQEEAGFVFIKVNSISPIIPKEN